MECQIESEKKKKELLKIQDKYYKLYLTAAKLQMKLSAECNPKELRKIIRLQKALLDVKELIEQKVAESETDIM